MDWVLIVLVLGQPIATGREGLALTVHSQPYATKELCAAAKKTVVLELSQSPGIDVRAACTQTK